MEHRSDWLWLLPNAPELKTIQADLARLAQLSIAHQLLDTTQAIECTPGLSTGAPAHRLSGCSLSAQLHLPEALPDLAPRAAIIDMRYSTDHQIWHGAPALGPSGHTVILLNLGHGDLGSALALGSARCISDRLAGLSPEVDLACVAPARWLHTSS